MQGMDKPLHFIAVLYIYDNLVKWLYRPNGTGEKKNKSIH